MSKYPEHDKLLANKAAHQVLVEFFDFLEREEFEVCSWGWDNGPQPEVVIARFFEIDHDAYLLEKDQMLAEIRRQNGDES